MLKVVGASWLQTRISTYIIVAVGLLGIGAIVLGEFGGVVNDGTYSATVFWNHKGGYRIDFWGQGNDLTALPKGAARAYYRPGVEETGWSTLEIETSATYPDAVQAYAAGFLEGSLTWQIIHHHWYNSVASVCVSSPEREELCERIRESLRENTAVIRERANLLATEDPFWHMVRLFYSQLDGMEAGWRFAVRRSRRSVEMDTEDFLWLAMASDLPEDVPTSSEDSSSSSEGTASTSANVGAIFVKMFDRTAEKLGPILAVAQNTVAPYSKMLRLLKRYTFGYHVSGGRHALRIPTRSIFMSSYPGAVSSHDEYYVVRGGAEDDHLFVLAGMPLLRDSSEAAEANDPKEQREKEKELDSAVQSVLSPARIMAASRLATDAGAWSRLLARGNPAQELRRKKSSRLQWVSVRPKDFSVWLIEQRPSTTHALDYTAVFRKNGFAYCDGGALLEIAAPKASEGDLRKNYIAHARRGASDEELARFFADNVTSVEAMRRLVRGGAAAQYGDRENDQDHQNVSSSSSSTARSIENVESRVSHALEPLGKFVYRGDVEMTPPRAVGVIDTKITIATSDGLESFEATSGPPFGHELTPGNLTPPFSWSKHFANVSHIGQPDKFEFQSVVPRWIWL